MKTQPLLALTVAASSLVAAPPPSLDLGLTSPPRPSPGYLNEWLRAGDPYMSQWNVGAQYRVRYEVRENAGFTGAGAGNDFSARPGIDTDNAYLLQKVLPRVGYTSKWVEVFVQGRTSSSTGDERGPGAGPESDGPIDLHQAYVLVGNHKEFPVSLKLGRQELSYGDERLVGAFAWNNIGRVFDAAKLRWQNSWFNAEAFVSKLVLPDDNNFNVWNDYDYFSGVHVTTRKIPKVSTDIYFLARNASAQAPTPGPRSPFTVGSARDIYTPGIRFRSGTNDFGNWDFTVESAAQYGHYNDPAIANVANRSLKHRAFMLAANAGHTWSDATFKPRLGLEYCYGSGDRNPNDDKHTTFENLFPTNHKFYGFADFASLQNLHNVRLQSSAKPAARLTILVEGHLFWLADTHDNFYAVNGARRGGIATTPGTGYGINPSHSSFVGGELDTIVTWALSPFASLEAGYAHFFRGDYVRDSLSAVGSRDAEFFYLQTLIHF